MTTAGNGPSVDARARTLDDGTDAGGYIVPPAVLALADDLGLTAHVHPECLAAIRAHLEAGYVEHYDRAQRDHAAGRHGQYRVNRRMAVALGWASGWIRGMG